MTWLARLFSARVRRLERELDDARADAALARRERDEAQAVAEAAVLRMTAAEHYIAHLHGYARREHMAMRGQVEA